MIVKMSKVFVVARSDHRDRLLDALRDLGVVHIAPIDRAQAVATSETLGQIDRLGRAIQLLAAIEPAGDKPDLPPVEAGEEVLEAHHRSMEGRARLNELHRQIELLEMWGDMRIEQFSRLRENGLDVRLFSASSESVGEFQGELVEVLSELPAERPLVAVVTRQGSEVRIPEDALPIELPERDRPAIRDEAGRVGEEMRTSFQRISQLAHLTEEIKQAREELVSLSEYTVAQRSGLAAETLFALQGWAPTDDAPSLGSQLVAADIDAAVEIHEPEPDEEPPTLIRYPGWVRPIKALFDILGTSPGYREYDLSPFFMIALPLFAAMLLGDAGYGLIFVLIALIFRRKLIAKAGKPAAQLLLIFGVATLLWGVLTVNYFGVTAVDVMHGAGYESLGEMQNASGVLATIGNAMVRLGVLWSDDPETARNIIIKISFIFGCLHLVLAHLLQALGMAPNLKSLSEIGWSAFLVGMLGVVWVLFFPNETWMPNMLMFALLLGGFVLVVLFSYPSRNLFKMIGLGLIANILPTISSFSDTISYIRLMAVGLASYYIASAFNGLAYQVGTISAWLIPASILIVLFAHALNIALGIIAIFAHGVRLNMLEFSSNAGVQWQGSPYVPFARRMSEAN